MTTYSRPRFADWRAGLAVGAAMGALILGVGGRMGMRVIAIAQHQPPAFSIEGSLAITMLGAVAGAAVAAVFLLSRTLFPTRRLWRVTLFWTIVALVVWRGLNPISWLSLSVFAPLFVIHGALLTTYWCRVRLRRVRLVHAGI